jgi:uncharacterized protein (UPF0276 family)
LGKDVLNDDFNAGFVQSALTPCLSEKVMKYAGIGFRRDIADSIIEGKEIPPSFLELAPENWIDMGGYWKKKLDEAAAKYPITCHGLSLSIGSPEDIDWKFLNKIKNFLEDYKIDVYSEHLSYIKSGNAHLYDLLPVPFREDAILHIVDRIKCVQDFLGMPIALENVSYYSPVAAEMSEMEFVSRIIYESGCNLLLDINNVYVNSFNHRYDAKDFIQSMPLEKVVYIHMAGHLQVNPKLIIDTHSEAIIDLLYDLFDYTSKSVPPIPVLLERDSNFEALSKLQDEFTNIEKICTKNWINQKHVVA